MKGSAVVVGAVNVDIEARLQNETCAGASNPARLQWQAGGVAGNVARFLGEHIETTLITATGNDAAAQQLTEQLHSDGLVLSNIQFPASSGHYIAVLDQHRDLLLGLSDSGPIEQLNPAHILQKLETVKTDALMVIDTNLAAQTLQQLLPHPELQSRRTSSRLIALAVSPAKVVKLLPLAHNIDLLLGNRAEFAALTGLPRDSAASDLVTNTLQAGFGEVVMTDGPGSLIIATANSYQTIAPLPAMPTDSVYSVNGAGDALAGGVVLGLALGDATEQSIRQYGLPAARSVIDGSRRAPDLARLAPDD